MSFDLDERHTKQVDSWLRQNTAALSSEKRLLFFGEAMRAVQRRATTTLSEVTLGVIIGRVLHLSKKKFPLLSQVQIDSQGISLDALVAENSAYTPEQVTEAFRFLLIELITLIGNLTADILTKPLYQELFKVTSESAQTSSKDSHRALRSVKRNSDRGDV